jgi:hypothetical protein
MRTDGRTDMTKLTVAFRNFANAPKKESRKGEAVPVHTMKAYRGNRSIAPLILNRGTRCRLAVNFTTLPWNVHRQRLEPRHHCVPDVFV